MNDKVKGFILSVNDYKENDLLLQVFTYEFGLISLIGKGAQKLSSHHHYLPFGLYEFIIDYKDNKTIFIPKGSKLLKNYGDFNDIKLLSILNVYVSVLLNDKSLLNKELFDDFLGILEQLNDSNIYLCSCLFFSIIIRFSGISPYVDGCVKCQTKKIIGLSNRNGGFLCKDHCEEKDILEVERLKKFRLINKAKVCDFDLVKDFDFDRRDLMIIEEFYEESLDTKVKAFEFFKKL